MTKGNKTWQATFQVGWIEHFLWLSYSSLLSGGICRYCILFPEQPHQGSGLGVGSTRSGVLILSPFQKPYTKALGRDNILVCHEETLAAERADLFLRNFTKPEERINSIMMREKEKQLEENRHVL